jgi:hypothetical protein
LTFMGVSPNQSRSNARPAASAKMAFHKILYPASLFVALLVWISLSVSPTTAQEDLPQITPGERKAPRKKDAEPRAVAVVQLTANGKASLVPIAILIGGKFWDATAYKADPIPMALESGTVYEAEHAGSSLGLFTVNSALHSNARDNVQSPWIGTGAWVPAGSEKAKPALKAEAVPLGIETSDAPPRLTRSAGTPQETPPPPASPPQNTSAGSPGSGQTGSSPTTPSPTAPSPTGSSPTNKSAPSTSDNSKPNDSQPSDAKPADSKPAGRSSTPQSDSGAGEANRPRLRRGKPVEPLPEDEVPGYTKPGAAASSSPANAGKTDPARADPAADKAPMQWMPAISDSSGPDPKSFAFEWFKGEESERLKQMTTLAKEQVRAYVEAQAKAKIMPAPKSAAPQSARRASALRAPTSKTPDPILDNVQMKTYDLWNNNQPVLVLTAEAHMPPPPAGSPHAADSDLQYSILLVTHPDIYNNLHKLYSRVTDKYHLDVTPRQELVDAVDADGDGRGELLFHEISDGGNGWVIYRATVDKLWKIFDSLNPE